MTTTRPVAMERRAERVILLVGAAAFFAGYDQNVFGLAIPQIQASLHIPENQVGLTVSYFRLATAASLLIAASAAWLSVWAWERLVAAAARSAPPSVCCIMAAVA